MRDLHASSRPARGAANQRRRRRPSDVRRGLNQLIGSLLRARANQFVLRVRRRRRRVSGERAEAVCKRRRLMTTDS